MRKHWVWGLRRSGGSFWTIGWKRTRPWVPHICSYRYCTSRLKCALPENRKVYICMIPRAFLSVCSVFDLHKPPYRKPIQQQPFNKYSSILFTHMLFKKWKYWVSKNSIGDFKKWPHFCSSKCHVQVPMVLQNTSVHERKSRKICVL